MARILLDFEEYYPPPTLANTFAYVSPVIAVFLGWMILDENINLRIIVATIVIIVGVSLIVNKNKIVLTKKK
jgi:drug/metabolite transporter (DMT)-like permease